MDDRVANLSPAQLATPGHYLQQVAVDGVLAWQVHLPDSPALEWSRWRKGDDHIHAPQKGRVDVFAGVGGHNDDAFEGFQSLQHVIGLEVRVTIVRALDARACTQERIAFV